MNPYSCVSAYRCRVNASLHDVVTGYLANTHRIIGDELVEGFSVRCREGLDFTWLKNGGVYCGWHPYDEAGCRLDEQVLVRFLFDAKLFDKLGELLVDVLLLCEASSTSLVEPCLLHAQLFLMVSNHLPICAVDVLECALGSVGLHEDGVG